MTCGMLDELFVPTSLGVVGHFLVAAAESWIRRSHRLLKRLCKLEEGRDPTYRAIQSQLDAQSRRQTASGSQMTGLAQSVKTWRCLLESYTYQSRSQPFLAPSCTR